MPSVYLLIFSLLLSAFFSAAETAFTSLTDMQVKIIQTKHPLQGSLIARLLKNSHLFLGIILIGNNASNLIFSVLSTKLTLEIFGSSALAIVTGIMIFVVLVFGEITPKQLAIQFNQQYMIIFIYPLFFFYFCLKPIAYILSLFSNIFYSKKSKHANTDLIGLSHKHFIKLFYNARDSGVLNDNKVSMVTRILSLDELSVEHVLIHRKEVLLLSSKLSLEEAKHAISQYSFSYFPIYENDDQDHIIGIINSNDISKIENSNFSLTNIMQDPLFIIENKTIQDALNMLRFHHAPLAIVLDEYGGLQGIVSIDDIISFIFNNEYSNTMVNTTSKDATGIKKINDIQYKLDGTTKISSIAEIIGIPLDSNTYALTIAGYIQEITRTLPTLQETIYTPYGKMFIETIEDNRITSLLWTPPHSNNQSASTKD